MTSSRQRFVSLALAGALITAVPTAFSLGKIGRGTLNVSASLNVEYDTNIFGNAVEVDDMSAIFTPGLSYNRAVGTISTTAQFGVRSISFTDTSGQDSIDPYLNATFNMDRDVKGKVSAAFNYARTTEANELLLTRTESDEFSGNFRVDYFYSDKTGVRMDTAFRVSDFSTAGFGDVQSTSLGGGLLYRYSQKLTADLSYSYSPEKVVRSQIATSNPNSDNHRISLGLEGELRPKVNGSISIGSVSREFDIGGSDQAMLVSSNLAWTASEKTTWNLIVSNNFDTTAGSESAEIFMATLAVRQALNQKISISGSVTHSESTLDQLPGPVTRTDEALLFNASVNYRLNDHYNASGGISHRISTSTLALAEYERTIVSLGLNATF
jgi:hypothetical protein